LADRRETINERSWVLTPTQIKKKLSLNGQRVFCLTIEGATAKVLKFVISVRSIYRKKSFFNELPFSTMSNICVTKR
jgi:hypothetical protein